MAADRRHAPDGLRRLSLVPGQEKGNDQIQRVCPIYQIITSARVHFRLTRSVPINRNQVAPAELEDILASHPDVVEAAVCAVFDSSQQTEIPVGYVSLKSSIAEKDHPSVLERILQHTNGMVAPYKKIRGGLHYLPTIPKNPTGKVMRALLPARMEAARIAAARPSKL